MIEPTGLEKCECGNDTFNILVKDQFSRLQFRCTTCGLIETDNYEPESEDI